MKSFIEKRLKIYEDELGRLAWISSNVLTLFFA